MLEVREERGARAARGCTEVSGVVRLNVEAQGSLRKYSFPDLRITRGGTVGVLPGNRGVGTGGGVAGANGSEGTGRGGRGGVTGGGGGRTATDVGWEDSGCL